MAPEILRGEAYSGKVADIFGIGLILFMMRSQTRAFGRASADDPYYKYLATNRPEKFWSAHLQSKDSDDYYSEEFKDLVAHLFSYNPANRLSISEIRSHPWFEGNMPSEEEVRDEFSQRKQDLDVELRRQRDEDPAQSSLDINIFEGSKVSRGLGGDDDEEVGSITREELEYDPDFKRYNQFFSTSQLEDLWNTLASYISSISSSYEFEASEYSVTAKVVKQIGK